MLDPPVPGERDVTETQESSSVQRISEKQDGQRQFLLHPEDNNLFVRTGKQVIDSCRLGISVELWLEELSSVMKEVESWCEARKDRVRSCYCAPRIAKLAFFFLPVAERFDFDLADELADLNSHLLKDFNVGMVETHQVPWVEADRFLDPVTARLVHGEALEVPRPMET